ncbi:MAG: Crp/Fnr family transcriptional regulator [Chromatocurvus sp.]
MPLKELFPAYFPQDLTDCARLLSLRKGDNVFTYGEPITSLYRVVRGRISLVHYTSEDTEVVLMRMGRGEFIAECSVCANIYTCEGRADTDSLVAKLVIADFDRKLTEDAAFARAWAMDLARRLKDQFLRYERLNIRSARERVLHLLYCEAGPDGTVSLPGPQLEWAADMGLTKETLYRVLSGLEAEGVLRRDGKKLVLISNHARRHARVYGIR